MMLKSVEKLREKLLKDTAVDFVFTSYPEQHGFRADVTVEGYEAIADEIDTEHERAMSRAGQLLADVEKDRDYNYANWQDCKQKVLQHNITIDELDAKIERLEDELSHCIELPKDADGVPIRVGDKTCYGVVTCIRDAGKGWEIVLDNWNTYQPCDLTHYHAPTVEDVLRDMLDSLDLDPTSHVDAGAVIAEYAKRLRLAGDAE